MFYAERSIEFMKANRINGRNISYDRLLYFSSGKSILPVSNGILVEKKENKVIKEKLIEEKDSRLEEKKAESLTELRSDELVQEEDDGLIKQEDDDLMEKEDNKPAGEEEGKINPIEALEEIYSYFIN